MAYQSNFFGTPQLPESNKFVEITNDLRFPPVSVIKWDYRDSGYSLSSVDIFSKYAVVTYLANPEDIKVSLSAENINVNLADVENILNVISPDVTTIKNNTDAVESTLTTISNNIGTTNTNVGTINTNVADIETLLTRTNALVNSVSANVADVGTINTAVGTINTAVGTTNTNVGTINTAVGTTNTNVGTINTAVGTINTAVGTINTNIADIETLLTRTNTLVNSVSALLGNQLGINGVVFCQPSNGTVTQNFNAIQVLSACKFSAIAIANSTTTGLVDYELPQNFILTAPITSLTLSYGAIIAFK